MVRQRRASSPNIEAWTTADFERFIEPPIPFLNPDYAIPSPLYHYTSGPAYVSILKCKYLRATNFSYLNDSSEVLYGTKLVCQELEKRRRSRTATISNFLDCLGRAFEMTAASEVYVCSFSGLRDDLGQWRAYGSSTIERVAIGFDPEALHDQSRAQPSATFDRVYYEATDQANRVGHIIDKSIEAIGGELTPAQHGRFAEATARRLSRLLPTLKDPKYRNENEWRIVLWTNDSSCVEFDTSRGLMRPYLRFLLPTPLPIIEVLILAPNRSNASVKAAKIVLSQAGLPNLEPQPSKVPFAE